MSTNKTDTNLYVITHTYQDSGEWRWFVVRADHKPTAQEAKEHVELYSYSEVWDGDCIEVETADVESLGGAEAEEVDLRSLEGV